MMKKSYAFEFINQKELHTFLSVSGKNSYDHYNVMYKTPNRTVCKMWPVEHFNKIYQPGIQDVYMSVNPLKYVKGSIRRTSEYIERLDWLFVDLDCTAKGYTPDQAMQILEEDYFGKKIPVPSLSYYSGRNIWLFWYVNEAAFALPRWRKVNQYLSSTLSSLGADMACSSDPAHLMRVPGSVNSKTGETTSFWYQYAASGQVRRYTLYEITEEYSVFANEKAKNRITPNIRVATLQGYRCNSRRIKDLVALLQKRDSMQRENRHCENIMFVIACTLLNMGATEKEMYRFIEELNASLRSPYKNICKYVKSALTNKGRKNHAYYFKTNTLLSMLDIQPEEYEFLQTLVPQEISKARASKAKKAANKKAYDTKLKQEGKKSAKEKIKERRYRISVLLKEGKTAAQIMGELQISKATFYRDVKNLPATALEDTAASKSGSKIVSINRPIPAHERKKECVSKGYFADFSNSLIFSDNILNVQSTSTKNRAEGTRSDYSWHLYCYYSRNKWSKYAYFTPRQILHA